VWGRSFKGRPVDAKRIRIPHLERTNVFPPGGAFFTFASRRLCGFPIIGTSAMIDEGPRSWSRLGHLVRDPL